MRWLIVFGVLLLVTMCAEVRVASAQGVYVGPGGVGVDTGVRERRYREQGWREDYRPRCRTVRTITRMPDGGKRVVEERRCR